LQLGGIGDDGTYSLGDDALLCLKDLRKWLKFGNGQFNRRDVPRCMAEANLVKGDLLEILAKVSPRVIEDKWRHKLAVATCTSNCFPGLDIADICKWNSSSP
jgi:replication fork protection complex subunit Tof1/Swi1